MSIKKTKIMSIDIKYQFIGKKIDSKRVLTLSSADPDLADLKDFLSTLPDGTLSLSESKIGDIVCGTFTVSGKNSAEWGIAGMDLLKLTFAGSFVMTVSVDANDHVDISAQSTATINKIAVTVHYGYPVDEDKPQTDLPKQWSLELSEGNIEHPLENLLSMASASSLLTSLPCEDVIFKALTLNKFSIVFDPRQQSETSIYLETAVKNGGNWEFGKLAITEVGIGLYCTHQSFDADSLISSYSVWLFGKIQIGDQNLELVLTLDNSDELLFDIIPEKNNKGFDTLTGFASLLPENGVKEAVNSGLKLLKIDKFDLEALRIAYDLDSRCLLYAYAGFDFTLFKIPFEIEVWLPDLRIKGSLQEGNYVTLAEILTSFCIPKDKVPDIELDVLTLEVDLQAKHYAFSFEISSDDWVINISDDKSIALTDIRGFIDIESASAAQEKDKYSVGIGCTFNVADVGIDVYTQYSSADGWVFKGETNPGDTIKIGELIGDLAFQFGIGNSIPDLLSGLIFENIAVEFDTGNKSFCFTCEAKFPIESQMVDIVVTLDIKKDSDNKYAIEFGGTLLIGQFTFNLIFDKCSTSTFFIAALQSDAQATLRELVRNVDADASDLMPDISVALSELLFVYQKKDKNTCYLFGAALYADLELTTLPLVGSLFDGKKDLGIKDIQLLYASKAIASDNVDSFNALLNTAKIIPLLPEHGAADQKKQGQENKEALKKGFNISAKLNLPDISFSIGAEGSTAPVEPAKQQEISYVALESPKSDSGTAEQADIAPTPPAGNASWFDIHKTIGPFSLQRVGVRYEDKHIWLLLDADFQLAVLSLGLNGLGIGFDPQNPLDIKAQLDGMSLFFKSGPVEIGGGFLHIGEDYLGEAMVKAGQYALTAIGGLATKDKSFFLFVRLNAPLGGPPYFYITGLAGGFGVNRNLRIPKIDDLNSFPLLPQNSKLPAKISTDPGHSLADSLSTLEKDIPVAVGEYWLAAGIDFSSFQIVDASVLLTVKFGVNFELLLLGICRITLPKLAPEPVVFLEVVLDAHFNPENGLIAVDGRITPSSFLYAGLVRITGGFAFYLWFAGEHAGDFVITAGGYHPHYQKPDHYPVVPRVQLSYVAGPLVMKGEAYLALLPNLLMCGLNVRITFDGGIVSAWLDAGLDFILGWRPFHYEAKAHVDVGASLDTTLLFIHVHISVHVGAELTIWGPEFGGQAKVDLEIYSFTIGFGGNSRNETVLWEDFKKSFFPAQKSRSADVSHNALFAVSDSDVLEPVDAHLCSAAVSRGLLKQRTEDDHADFFSWTVDPNDFMIVSNTLIPAKKARFNDYQLNNPFTAEKPFTYKGAGSLISSPEASIDSDTHPDGMKWPTDFGVLPVGIGSEFESEHLVSLCKLASGKSYTDLSGYTDTIDNVSLRPVLANSQPALWGTGKQELNGERMINGTLAGLCLSPIIQHPEVTLRADLWSMLFDQANTVEWRESTPEVPATDRFYATVQNDQLCFTRAGSQVKLQGYALGDALTANDVTEARNALFNSLQSLGLNLETGKIKIDHFANYPLEDWPIIEMLGEENTHSQRYK